MKGTLLPLVPRKEKKPFNQDPIKPLPKAQD